MKKQKLNITVVVATLQLILASQGVTLGFCAEPSEPVEYEAEGTLVYSGWNLSMEVVPKFSSKFKISAKGKNWLIQAVPESSKSIKMREYGFDDGALYYHVKFDRKTMESKPIPFRHPLDIWKLDPQDLKSRPRNDAIGVVYSGSVPRPGGHFMHAVWLAFMSGTFLTDEKEKELPIMWLDPIRHHNFKPIIKWRLKESTPMLTEEIEFRNDGKIPVSRGSGNEEDIKVMEPPFANGYLDAKYSLIQSTNLHGITLPVRFSLDVFRPKKDAENEKGLLLYSTLFGSVEKINVRPEVVDTFKPELTGKTRVKDFRVSGYPPSNYPESLSYYAEEGETWKTIEEVKAGARR